MGKISTRSHCSNGKIEANLDKGSFSCSSIANCGALTYWIAHSDVRGGLSATTRIDRNIDGEGVSGTVQIVFCTRIHRGGGRTKDELESGYLICHDELF